MPNPWQYSRGRRIATQVVMWVILGITVGLAALVSAHRRTALQVALGSAQTVKHVTITLPKDWEVTANRNDMAPTVLTARPSDDDSARIVVTFDPLPQHRTPVETALASAGKRGRDKIAQEPLTIAGHPGVLISYAQKQSMRGFPGQEDFEMDVKSVVAATVLPSGKGLSIELNDFGEPEAADLDLVRRIVASVSIKGEPALEQSSEVKLRGDITVVAPDGFDLIHSDDPQSTERVLRAREAKDWRSISLVPTVLLPKDGAPAIVTMLTAYDSQWAESAAKEQSPRHWRVDLQDVTAALPNPQRAYLLADETGAALLAIFSGGKDDAWIEPAWQQLSAKVSFPRRDQIESMLAEGASEASRLSETGLAKLLPPARDEAWWLLCIGTPERPLGWIHETPAATGGKLERRVHFAENYTEQILCDFDASADLKTYRALLDGQMAPDRRSVAASSSPQFERALTVTSKLKAGKLDLAVKPRDGASTNVQTPAPANFVPGAILWQIVGQLSDRPMILRTDLALGALTARPTAPLTLIIGPDNEAPPRTTEDSSTPLRCVSVEVAGSRALSRWYFRADGTLESIDYDQHVRQVRREAADISPDFARVPAMKP